MNAAKILLRKAGLIRFADSLNYVRLLYKSGDEIRKFKSANPGVKLPPPYFIYETFNLDYASYYHGGRETAMWLADYFRKYKDLQGLNILDWGCGPGRIIRHLPEATEHVAKYFGTDYNKEYVNWCTKNIPEADFSINGMKPPLNYPDGFFDIAYGISIFTHLSEEMHYQWFEELMRILKPGGILFLTLHGAAFYGRLSEPERKQFDEGHLVIKGNTKEGHRTYGAFHPETFTRKLVGENVVLEHSEGNNESGKPQQDIWVIKKI